MDNLTPEIVNLGNVVPFPRTAGASVSELPRAESASEAVKG